MLEVRNLCKSYGAKTAVSDISFDIDIGKIYGLLGPNGAGKSTTMNIIAGYLAAGSGTVTIDGYDILKDPVKAKKRTGYLPEVPPLYPDLTVREYLDFVSELKGVKARGRSETVGGVMDRTKLYSVETRLIKNLSKGFRQRVGIAAALIGYPKLIILDEPTAGLDPAEIIEIRELILSLKDGHAVILSSHILQEISAVCDHIMVISHGKLMAKGTPKELADSMNMDSGTSVLIKGQDDGIRAAFEGIDGVREVIVNPAEDGNTKVDIKSDAAFDIREAVFRKSVEKGLILLGLNSRRLSLEDVYMKLTSDEYAAELLEKAAENDEDVKESTDTDTARACENAVENEEEPVEEAVNDTETEGE